MSQKKFPSDVNLLKVDVPADASVDTPWQLTRISLQRYYEPIQPKRESWNQPARLEYQEAGVLDGEVDRSEAVGNLVLEE